MTFNLLVPDKIHLHFVSPRKSAQLTVQSVAVAPVLKVINAFIQSQRGRNIRRSSEFRSSRQEIYVTAQFTVSSYDLWQLRLAIQHAGGIIERVQENHVTRSFVSAFNQRPAACLECRHYYGKKLGQQLLICAMHPYGPLAECVDKEL